MAGTGLERLANAMLGAIEDYARVTAAFEDLSIAPLDLAKEWIVRPKFRLP